MLLRSVLLFAAAVSVVGQTALIDALGLTEMQMWQLRQEKPAPVAQSGIAAAGRRSGDFARMRPYKDALDEALRNPILDAVQQAKLAEIVKVLDRWRAAAEAMAMGLIGAAQWPGSSECLTYPIRSFPSEFDLSDSQVGLLEALLRDAQKPLWAQLKEKEKARSEMSDSKSLAAGELAADVSRLSQQVRAIRPPRNLALAILNDAQRAKVAAFELDLKLVREAIDLKLIPAPPIGEALCQ